MKFNLLKLKLCKIKTCFICEIILNAISATGSKGGFLQLWTMGRSTYTNVHEGIVKTIQIIS